MNRLSKTDGQVLYGLTFAAYDIHDKRRGQHGRGEQCEARATSQVREYWPRRHQSTRKGTWRRGTNGCKGEVRLST